MHDMIPSPSASIHEQQTAPDKIVIWLLVFMPISSFEMPPVLSGTAEENIPVARAGQSAGDSSALIACK